MNLRDLLRGSKPTHAGRKLVAKPEWRTVGGQRCYFRSKREAAYAETLEMMRRTGSIVSWEHEPGWFYFDGIRAGVTRYLPDFRVTFANGRIEYHEVKGWLDPKSVTALRRMAKYHPTVKVVLIGAKMPEPTKRRRR